MANTDDWCARCGAFIRNARVTGTPSLYNPGGDEILLCEPCFFDEGAEIEAAGTNDLPDRLAAYHRTLASLP